MVISVWISLWIFRLTINTMIQLWFCLSYHGKAENNWYWILISKKSKWVLAERTGDKCDRRTYWKLLERVLLNSTKLSSFLKFSDSKTCQFFLEIGQEASFRVVACHVALLFGASRTRPGRLETLIFEIGLAARLSVIISVPTGHLCFFFN